MGDEKHERTKLTRISIRSYTKNTELLDLTMAWISVIWQNILEYSEPTFAIKMRFGKFFIVANGQILNK